MVQTNLPIAVYMSGGIDSTAVLVTAMKYHPNVTAIIIGNEESSDKKIAVKYCEDNKIKYVTKIPNVPSNALGNLTANLLSPKTATVGIVKYPYNGDLKSPNDSSKIGKLFPH